MVLTMPLNGLPAASEARIVESDERRPRCHFFALATSVRHAHDMRMGSAWVNEVLATIPRTHTPAAEAESGTG